MYNPQSFVLGILFIVIGIPVLSGTIISIIHGPKELRKDKKYRRKNQESEQNTKDREMLEEIYYGLGDLGKRVKNLETILQDQGDKNE